MSNPFKKQVETAVAGITQQITVLAEEVQHWKDRAHKAEATLGKVRKVFDNMVLTLAVEEEKVHPPKKRKISRKKKVVEAPATNGVETSKSRQGKRLTEEEKTRIQQLDKEGLSGNKIAKAIGRSQYAVATFLRSINVPQA